MKIKVVSIFLFYHLFCFSQSDNKSVLKLYKVGFLYNQATNENFVFDDPDYTFIANTYKLQGFYKLGNWRNTNFELIVQPQVQFLQHQLINEQYITPDKENYLEKRDEFTQIKNLSLYGLEFAFSAQRKILTKLNIQGGISLGFSYIDKRTERLAKGFTFIENFSLGFNYQTTKKSFFYLGTNFGHISNLDFQKPNDGYNILGVELGVSYLLK